MSRIAFLPALLLTCTFSLPPVGATLIDVNDLRLPSYQSADGLNITHDTLTSLEWLDIVTTTNISYYSMTALLGVGELVDFRYATLSEIDTFFNHLGLLGPPRDPPPPCEHSGCHGELFFGAVAHTGISHHPPPSLSPRTSGWYTDAIAGEGGQPPLLPIAQFGYYPRYEDGATDVLWVTPGDYVPVCCVVNRNVCFHSLADPSVGNWIVRDCRSVDCVIPEPSHLGVWGLLGAFGLAVSRGRRRFGSPSLTVGPCEVQLLTVTS